MDSKFKDEIPKTHEEILDLVDEIKVYEYDFVDFIFEESKPEVEEELIEVKPDTPKIVKPIPIKPKEEKYKHVVKPFFKPRTPATFKIRFDEKGKLTNLDFKKVKPSNDNKTGKKFSIKKLIPSRKVKKDKAEPKEGKSKKSKLKGGFGKLGKLKKVIPSKGKKGEKTEAPKAEE